MDSKAERRKKKSIMRNITKELEHINIPSSEDEDSIFGTTKEKKKQEKTPMGAGSLTPGQRMRMLSGVQKLKRALPKIKQLRQSQAQMFDLTASMRPARSRKSWLIYPDNNAKEWWDVTMSLVLIASCVFTPIVVAFMELGNLMSVIVLNGIIDSLFLIDIFINFNSAYVNPDLDMVDDRKTIVIDYLQGWFFIDLLAIMPFEIFMESHANEMVRVIRIGRIYKLVKLLKLLRIFKVMKDKSRLLKLINNLGQGIQRLIILIVLFLFLNHIVACFWIICGNMSQQEEDFTGTWLEGKEDMTPEAIYMISLYWTVTTITTVGYGDISGTNNIERAFCSFVMLAGVIAFSFASGSLASILQNIDSSEAAVNEKNEVLEKLSHDFKLPAPLIQKIKKSMLI